jgi:hypothetical protein
MKVQLARQIERIDGLSRGGNRKGTQQDRAKYCHWGPCEPRRLSSETHSWLRGPTIPTAFRTQIATATTTTLFRIDLILPAMGMKLSMSHQCDADHDRRE